MVSRAGLALVVMLPMLLGAGEGLVQKAVGEIPEEYRMAVGAPTLMGLVEKVRPTLRYDYASFHLLIWAAMDKKGRPTFSLATANLLPVAGKTGGSWAI